MTQTAFAASWYRIAGLRPRLRAHADIHRHRTRGRVWYVLQDRQTGRFFRISAAANLILCLMDGRRTMEEIWQAAGARLGTDRPTRSDVFALLAQLHQADLLLSGLPPDMAELDRRADRQGSRRMMLWLRNPLALRLPLLDPDRFLDRTLPLARLVFSPAGLALWLALVATALVLVSLHWDSLAGGISDRVFSTDNVLMLAVIYPLAKALHELAHAYTTRLGGGEVHEMGIMLLVLFPVPYVDASGATAFRGRWRRALVGAAGIMVELALASLATIAWVALEPGLARAAMFNVMLLCGVTTLVFNANPLLRFDGYYVLSDLIEIPNLDTRAKRYLLYLLQRYLLGVERADSPVQAAGERAWLAGYGVVAGLYRLSIMLGIALVVAAKFFVLGVALALLSVGQMLVLPLLRGLRFLATGLPLRRRRRRAILAVAAVCGLAGLLLFALPLPYASIDEGVVWVPEEAALRAGADGAVARLLAVPGAIVAAGQPLIAQEDPVAAAAVAVDRAQAVVLRGRYVAVNLIDRVQALLVHEELDRAEARLARAEQRQRDLLLVASRPGRFVVPDADHLIGAWRRQGEVLGYVIGSDDAAVRVVVPQAEIDLVRRRTRGVAIRTADRPDVVQPAVIVRQTPSALERAPAPALTPQGGGPMLLDPASPKNERPLERFYEVELRPAEATPAERIGSHAYARFDFGAEPVAWRLLRGLRQLFLRTLDA
jgi:putative peptide zinc metalloprotease protein